MKLLKTRNPYTHEDIGQLAMHELTDMNKKTTLARQAFVQWRQVPIEQRVQCIEQALQYFETHRTAIAQAITQQMGKPIQQSQAEIDGLFERAQHLCRIAPTILSPESLPQQPHLTRKIIHEPLGVIFIMAAWNYPLLVAINGVISALLAGNVVILKHSSLTPSIGEHFEAAFQHLANINHTLQHCILDHQTSTRYIEQSDIDHVIFTGSVSGGRKIYASTAHRLIDCSLELGGKDAAYVAADADVAAAAAGLVDGALYNAGQSCCGIERLYVHESLYTDFIDHCLPLLNAYQLGDPNDPNTTLGPMARSNATTVLAQQVQEAVSQGAKIRVGGQAQSIGEAIFFQPTLLTDVTHDMRIMQEENFGPIMPVMKVANDAEAIQAVNDSAYGLTAAIYTQDPALATSFSEQVNVGTVFMNRCDYLDPALPWSGVRNSGKSCALSSFGFYTVTRRKSLNFRTL